MRGGILVWEVEVVCLCLESNGMAIFLGTGQRHKTQGVGEKEVPDGLDSAVMEIWLRRGAK